MSCSVSLKLTLIWGIDILTETLTQEIVVWIWKTPFTQYVSGGWRFRVKPSSFLISLVATCTLRLWGLRFVRLAKLLVRLVEKMQFKSCLLLCPWRRRRELVRPGRVNILEKSFFGGGTGGGRKLCMVPCHSF